MTDAGYECLVENTKSSNLPPKVVQYEQFLNDILRSDLKYVKSLHSDNFHRSHQCQDTDGMNRRRRRGFTSACQCLYARIIYSKLNLMILILISNF